MSYELWDMSDEWIRGKKQEVNISYFLCILRNLRWYKRITMIPMTPITAKVVKAMSMSVIFINLRSVYKETHYKEYACSNDSYPEGIPGEFVG